MRTKANTHINPSGSTLALVASSIAGVNTCGDQSGHGQEASLESTLLAANAGLPHCADAPPEKSSRIGFYIGSAVIALTTTAMVAGIWIYWLRQQKEPRLLVRFQSSLQPRADGEYEYRYCTRSELREGDTIVELNPKEPLEDAKLGQQ